MSRVRWRDSVLHGQCSLYCLQPIVEARGLSWVLSVSSGLLLLLVFLTLFCFSLSSRDRLLLPHSTGVEACPPCLLSSAFLVFSWPGLGTHTQVSHACSLQQTQSLRIQTALHLFMTLTDVHFLSFGIE